MPSAVAGSTKPKTLRHPQQRPPSVFAAFMDEVPHFQTSERVPFAQLQDAVDHFANGLAMSLRFGLLRLSREYLFDVDLDGHTPRTSLRSQLIRNVDGNFHRAILARTSLVFGDTMLIRPQGEVSPQAHGTCRRFGALRATPVTNNRPDPIFRMRADK
jgi:hypothetical protein